MDTNDRIAEEPGVLGLHNIAGGAALERFDHQLKRVLENIADPNTAPTAKRTIILEVVVAPNDDRKSATIVVQTKAKLAAPMGVKTVAFLGKHEGRHVAMEQNPDQLTLKSAKTATEAVS